MGLPDGHVTGVPGLSRNDQLHALGNGVVPQQAGAAVEYLLRFAPVWVRADLGLDSDGNADPHERNVDALTATSLL